MSEYFLGEQIEAWKAGMAQTITFVITQDCNLRCKYCYMTGKNNSNIMPIEVGKQAIDYFLENSNLFVADALILEFIGGEPLLEIDLLDELTDYFKVRAYNLGHKWFDMYRISISTNGLLYSSEKVQKYIMKNKTKLSIGITIDGTKEKNDLQRVYPDGSGSYEDIIKNVKLWQEQFPGATTKVTVGHDDLCYLKDSIIHLWNIGLDIVPANIVFEDVWQEGDDEVYYNQLRELADYVIDNEYWEHHNTSLFAKGIGYPLEEEELHKNSCGSGAMIAVDAKGNLYPCIRFMGYSLANKEGYVTGNIYDGIDADKVRPFYTLDCKSQSDEECLTCEVASGCQWCTGYNYDQSKYGTLFERNKSICKMHKARVKANNYLWSRLSREKKLKVDRHRSTRKNLFIMLADNSVTFCNYSNDKVEKDIIKIEYLREAAKFCNENFYTAVLLHSDNTGLSRMAIDEFRGVQCINIYPAKNAQYEYNEVDIVYHNCQSIVSEKYEGGICCVLEVKENEVGNLANAVEKALKHYQRVNVNLIYEPKSLDTNLYDIELKKIVQILFPYFRSNVIRQVNIVTDELFNKKRSNCNFGFNNYTLAPNGLVYTCPAFYYDNRNDYLSTIEELYDYVSNEKRRLFNIENNVVCQECDIKHCNWCAFWNKKNTGEYGVPAAKQCQISQIEYSATYQLYMLLYENNSVNKYMKRIENIDLDDPILFQKSFSKAMLNFSYFGNKRYEEVGGKNA